MRLRICIGHLMASYLLRQYVCNVKMHLVASTVKPVNVKHAMKQIKHRKRFTNGGSFLHGLEKNCLLKVSQSSITITVFGGADVQPDKLSLWITSFNKSMTISQVMWDSEK